MKASVVQMCAEAKDYIDINAILVDGRIDLPMALAGARAIYGSGLNPLATLKALVFLMIGHEAVVSRFEESPCPSRTFCRLGKLAGPENWR